MTSLQVFCDESGFTGENLSNRDQRFFAYSSVAIANDAANDVVAKIARLDLNSSCSSRGPTPARRTRDPRPPLGSLVHGAGELNWRARLDLNSSCSSRGPTPARRTRDPRPPLGSLVRGAGELNWRARLDLNQGPSA